MADAPRIKRSLAFALVGSWTQSSTATHQSLGRVRFRGSGKDRQASTNVEVCLLEWLLTAKIQSFLAS